MKWVLIFYIVYGSASPTSVRFNTEAACTAAKQWLLEVWKSDRGIQAKCFLDE